MIPYTPAYPHLNNPKITSIQQLNVFSSALKSKVSVSSMLDLQPYFKVSKVYFKLCLFVHNVGLCSEESSACYWHLTRRVCALSHGTGFDALFGQCYIVCFSLSLIVCVFVCCCYGNVNVCVVCQCGTVLCE